MSPSSIRLRFGTVFFDVDSTLVGIEGIDVLAGGDSAIAEMTAAAMNGTIPLDEVYARRLDRIRPHRTALDALSRSYLSAILPGVERTFDVLRSAGANIHLLTAGIAQAIEPLAEKLLVPRRRVHAVSLEFSSDGEYRGFDRKSFLTRPGGKELVVRDVRARTHGKAALVGDGVSDLEARNAVDLFIGFGGVAVRERVRDEAEIFLKSRDFSAVLPHLIEGSHE